MMRGILIGFVLLTGGLRADQHLPVFLADNHAETFTWITRTFDVDESYHLVLIDAHTDASAVERSEEIREQLRRVPSLEERRTLVEQWRHTGRIQAYNWIEPIMPRPITNVLWVAKSELDENQLSGLTAEAVSQMDGRLEVEPRSSGSFANRWQTRDIEGLLKWDPGDRAIILSFDLDFLAGMNPAEREEAFSQIWTRAMDWPGLRGVSFSVSRPWLADDAEADALVRLACSAVSRTRGAVLEIDTRLDIHPDHSALAVKSTKPIARWDAASASQGLRITWQLMGDSLKMISNQNAPLNRSNHIATIKPDDGEMDCDGFWRFAADKAPVLRVHAQYEATGKVRWFMLEPARAAYDFLPETKLGKDFSKSPARWIYLKRRELYVTTDFALDHQIWSKNKIGQLRLEAEVETADGWLPVKPIDIRLHQGQAFHAALSECFGMPYGFGIAGVAENSLTGVETGWASDCSNMLIYAWRRNGVKLKWGDPGGLRRQLSTLAENVDPADRITIPSGAMEKGMMIDFGKHAAALWQDVEPIGKLDGDDLVLHHLGGFPEIVTLANLAKDRPRFAVRVPKADEPQCTIKIAGDVVLASDDMKVHPEFNKGKADLFLANLEGVASMKEPKHRPRYDFRFPADRLKWLKSEGIDAVSLANNHAGDAGEDGLLESITALRASGIHFFGAGKNSDEACQSWRTEMNGVAFAFFGVCLVDAMAAGDQSPGVCKLPEHADLMKTNLMTAKAKGEHVVVLVHGGDEYKKEVNDTQREWALWLIAHGADVIAGSHPHVIQRTEIHAGSEIFHSLGNAVYPKALSGADSGKVVTLPFSKNIPSVRAPNLPAESLKR